MRSTADYTGPHGTVHLSLVPGSYVLRVYMAGDSQEELRGQSEPVTVKAGQEVTADIVIR